MSHKRLLAPTAVAVSLAAATAAFAQPSAEKAAAAQVLFDEGMKLMASGQFAAACPKLKSAQKLDPGMATQFRLAECYEKLGATASAWVLYIEVANAAKAANSRDREAFARKRAQALEPRLSRMTITVAPALSELAGLTIKRDGILVEKPLWGTAVPVDPGEHFVTAQAPGKKPWEAKGMIERDATALNVAIPALDDLPKAVGASASASEPVIAEERGVQPVEEAGRRRSVVPAIIAGGAAIAAAGAGVGMLLLSNEKEREMVDLNGKIGRGGCLLTPPDSRCPALLNTASAVDNFRYVSFGAFVGAGILVAGGLTYLLWPVPKTKMSRFDIHAAPGIGHNHGSMVVWGSF